MKKNSAKLSLIGIICLLSAGCSDDVSTKKNTDTESGQISNGLITLTYGNSLLDGNVELKNSKIEFDKLAGNKSISARSSIVTNDYQIPDLSNATKLTGSSWVNINDDKLYYIPEGVIFTGGINFNGKGTLLILGIFAGTNGTNVPDGAKVEIAPTGNIASTVRFHLNSGSTLNNYGSTSYTSTSVDGKINNYNEFIFVNSVALNGSSEVNNYCGLSFEGNKPNINSILNNDGFINFKGGFHVNGSGKLILRAGSLTDITGGEISIDGNIRNEEQGIARIDISNATIGNMNASPAFSGQIDINTGNNTRNITVLASKISSEVTLNGNAFIAAKGCTPSRGIPPCDAGSLEFTLCATVSSPSMNNINLSATDVRINNGLAYVSYHTNDEIYGNVPVGALRIFNIQDQKSPVLISEAVFNDVEFNGVDINDNELYAVGGNKAGSRIVHTPLINGAFNTSDLSVFKTYAVPGVAVKNSFLYNNMLWLASGGTDGGFFKVDPSKNYESTKLYGNGARAKYTVQNNAMQVFFAVEADGAYLQMSDIAGNNPREYRYNSLVQSITTGKNAIAIDDDYAYIALSDRGVAKIELTTGVLVNHFQPNEYIDESTKEKIFKQNGYTNGVAVTDCFVFLANGADGIIVLEKDNFNVIGSFKLPESANFVYVKEGLLFVATGRDGLNIIKIN